VFGWIILWRKRDEGRRGSKGMDRKGVHTVIIIVADDNLFNLAILAHLTPEILIECVEVVL
jgi:hypothetical protein